MHFNVHAVTPQQFTDWAASARKTGPTLDPNSYAALAVQISGTTLVWGPSIPVALVVLAIAQMGVHLVFFLHITTGADNVNNVMALAFGILIVLLLLAGSLWIMAHLNHNMLPMDQLMQMQR
jgi:cytochrome o ubiquinol oxidase subunit IV